MANDPLHVLVVTEGRTGQFNVDCLYTKYNVLCIKTLYNITVYILLFCENQLSEGHYVTALNLRVLGDSNSAHCKVNKVGDLLMEVL